MFRNKRDFKIEKNPHDRDARPFKDDIIFDIHILSNKLIFIYYIIKFLLSMAFEIVIQA